MALLLALLAGVLAAVGMWLLLQRSVARIILGLAMIGHAANIVIFTSGGLERSKAPLIEPGGAVPNPVADPLPQAFVLTAIVISFGVVAFALVLVYRAWQSVGTDDVDAMEGRAS